MTDLSNRTLCLSLGERDRRWSAVRTMMAECDVKGLLIGSYRGRERHESYVIDDEVDGCVVFPMEGDPTVLTWSATFLSRTIHAADRGMDLWTTDYRLGRSADDIVSVLAEMGLESSRLGVVGLSATSPGELDGIVPYSFWVGVRNGLPKADFIDLTGPYADLWLFRSDEELELLRHAAHVSDRVVGVMVEATRPGVRESDVYAAIVGEVYANACYLKYPYLSLQSGAENIGWGPPRWTVRAEAPRVLQRGDMVQAEIHTCYGGLEGQVQASVALDPVSANLRRCEDAVLQSYEAGVAVLRQGITLGELVASMERPLKAAGCWAKTPLAHTLTFGAVGFSMVNREQLEGTTEQLVETGDPGNRRLDMELRPGMPLELEPNASIQSCRVNIGGTVIVTDSGCEELNVVATRVHHVDSS